MADSPLTEARNHVADALSTLGVRVYATPTAAPSPPCVEIVAGEDWITRIRLNSKQVDVHVGMRCSVPATTGNSKALASLESVVWEIMGLVPVREPVVGPRTVESGQSNVYVVDLTTVVTATASEE